MQAIQGIRFIHNAIKQGVAQIEAAAAGVASAEDATALADRVQFLAHEVHMHTTGEEDAIYPLLDERAVNVGAHYLFDHQQEARLFERVLDLLADWSPSPAYGDALRCAATSLRYHTVLHVDKEDRIVVPLVMRYFSDEEQKGMIQRAVSRYSPEQLMQTFPWIVRAQTPEDRVTFLRDDLQRLMPPEVFAAVRGWIQAGIPASDWAEIVRRAPELG